MIPADSNPTELENLTRFNRTVLRLDFEPSPHGRSRSKILIALLVCLSTLFALGPCQARAQMLNSADSATETASDESSDITKPAPPHELALPTTGLVVFADDNRPASNAEVVAYTRSGKELQSMRADKDGRFPLQNSWWNDPVAGETEVILVARVGNEQLGWFDFQQHRARRRLAAFRKEDASTAVKIMLLACDAKVTGRLVGFDGGPAAGVRVRAASLYQLSNRYASWFGYGVNDMLPFPSDVTNEQGRFSLSIPAKTLREVEITHPNWVTQKVPVHDGEDAGNVRLKPAGKIAGRVLEAATGKGIGGATVGARGFKSEGDVGGYGFATTDADGSFLVGGLNPDFYSVQVRKLEERPKLVPPLHEPVSVAESETTRVQFALIEGRRIWGRVVEGTTGTPIAGGHVIARVTARPNDLSGGVGRLTRSDDQGAFELFVPPGVCRIRADDGPRELHSETSRTIDVAADAEPIEIVLKVGPIREQRILFGGASPPGTSTTTESGMKPMSVPKPPVLTVHLRTVTPQAIGEHAVRLVFNNSNLVAEWSLQSGATFNKEFLEREIGRVARLLIDVPGFTPTSTPQFSVGRDMKPIEVKLEPAVEVPVRGLVVGQNREPISGVRVRVRRIFHGSDTEFPWGVETATDDDGRFELKHLYAGHQVAIHLAKAGVAEFETHPLMITRQEAIDLGRLTLVAANQAVSGRVTDQDGLPVAGARVVFDGVPKRETQCNTEGRFSLTGLPAGRLELKLFATDGSRTSRYVISGSSEILLFLPLATLSNRPEYRLSVTLRTPDGKPPAQAQYYLLDLTTQHWRKSGTFRGNADYALDLHSELRRYPDHQYALMVLADGFATKKPAAIVTRPQLEPLSVELQPVAMGTLVGRVVDEQGQPISGASVGLSLEITEGVLIESWKYISNLPEEPPVTDADGRFRFPGMHAGTRAEVYVNQSGRAGAWSQRVTIDGQDEIALPELVLRKSTREIRGRVVDVEGRAIAGARVWVHDFSRPETTTDTDGRFTLTAVPAGELVLIAAAAGYDDASKAFSVEKAGELTMTLQRDPAQYLPVSTGNAASEAKPRRMDNIHNNNRDAVVAAHRRSSRERCPTSRTQSPIARQGSCWSEDVLNQEIARRISRGVVDQRNIDRQRVEANHVGS